MNEITANPKVNRLLSKISDNNIALGKKPYEKLLSDKVKSEIIFPRRVPMSGLVHLRQGRGISSSDIERHYKETIPSIYFLIFLSISSWLRSFFS